MSMDSLRWALKANPGNSSRKLVLISLADRAGETHECFPGLERLERDTCLNMKTIKKCLGELRDLGFIKDTGRRVGKTGRVKVWKLLGVSGREDEAPAQPKGKSPSSTPPVENEPNTGPIESDQIRNDTKNGIIPNFPGNEAKTGLSESAQKRATEPPIDLTTQYNPPASCSDLADATPSPLESEPAEGEVFSGGELVTEDDCVVSGWSFGDLIEPGDPELLVALPLRSDQRGGVYPVTRQMIVDFRALHPGLDVEQEFRLMLGWLIGNPAKRKTLAGMPKFITAWLARAQKQGGSPYCDAAPALSGYRADDESPKAKRARLRAALRNINDTSW